MSNQELYISVTRPADDLTGVFESDGETGYFYLHRNSAPEGEKIVGAIHIFSGNVEISQNDLQIAWSNDESTVGLFIKTILWAAFEFTGKKYGGNYLEPGQPAIPLEIKDRFDRS